MIMFQILNNQMPFIDREEDTQTLLKKIITADKELQFPTFPADAGLTLR